MDWHGLSTVFEGGGGGGTIPLCAGRLARFEFSYSLSDIHTYTVLCRSHSIPSHPITVYKKKT